MKVQGQVKSLNQLLFLVLFLDSSLSFPPTIANHASKKVSLLFAKAQYLVQYGHRQSWLVMKA